MAEITMAELFDGQSSKCAESAAPMSCVARHSPGARTSLPAVCTVDPLDSRGYPMPPFGTVVQRGLELKKDVWGLQQAIKRTNSDIMRRWAKTPSSDDPVHARRSSLPRFFESHDFPPGLCVQMRESLKLFPTRVWVLDNSSSMRDAGGKHYACSRTYNAVTKIRCSRWEELRNLARIHGQFAAASGATTTFHLLNPPSCGKQQIQVSDSTDLSDLREALHSQPEGHTPLTSTIRDITKTIRDNVAELLLNKKKVVVVIASDGLPTDTTGKSTVSSRADFRDALENLQRLPVWIVVRLLTDDATVVRFWNTVDQELEAPIEVWQRVWCGVLVPPMLGHEIDNYTLRVLCCLKMEWLREGAR